MLKRLLKGNRKEEEALVSMREHLGLLCSATETFDRLLNERKEHLVERICDLEREGDMARRKVLSTIFEGAFLPYLRPNLCRFVELVDEAFDTLEDAARTFAMIRLHPSLTDECLKIASLNKQMCEILAVAFEITLQGGDLREQSLAVRILEKRVDDLKHDIFQRVASLPVAGFWDGKFLADFLESLTRFSDLLEDAADALYILSVSFR
ncbi:hypothetical protein SAMN02745206_02817 [Desulfacinum infernum DSM 9756]|uniref:TIGR00153 family protein n=1 Tax=Desulfacinum infernum DSM 9756 TaxID=1121391 RepID=A0A1M5F7A2_9BACT|nr:TIGR00153 family protein [Desulfacinum infernum]SHF87375.1 hypothetical protein SAMN02745206_02817 [Desulfacinum infernum DSM 9756]